MKHRHHIWPIIAGSAVGAVGVAVAATRFKNRKGETPAEIAGNKITEVTRETKQRIEEIIGDVREHLPAQGSAAIEELNRLVADAKAKLDLAAAQMKSGMQKLYDKTLRDEPEKVHREP